MSCEPWLDDALLRAKPSGQGPYGVFLKQVDEDEEDQLLSFEDAVSFRAYVLAHMDNIDLMWTPDKPVVQFLYQDEQFADIIMHQELSARRRQLLPACMWTLAFVIAMLLIVYVVVIQQSNIRGTFLLLIYGVAWVYEKGPDTLLNTFIQIKRLRDSARACTQSQLSSMYFQIWMGSRRAPAALYLCVLMGVLFLIQQYIGVHRSIGLVALDKVRMQAADEWWRLLSVGYLHGSIIHVLFNGLVLFIFGGMVERLLGAWRMLFIFWLSVLGGSLLSTWWSDVSSVGASGGVMGLGGAIAAVGLWNASLRQADIALPIIRWLILMVFIGLIGIGMIDNAAHAGGFLGGVIASAICVPRHAFQNGRALGDAIFLKMLFALTTLLGAVIIAVIMLLA